MKQKTETTIPSVLGKIVEKRIFIIRGHRVLLSSDLAELYQSQPRILLQAVKRNLRRFPSDFMFQLTIQKLTALKSQFVISKLGRGGVRHAPYVFTEQGVAMLSGDSRANSTFKYKKAIYWH